MISTVLYTITYNSYFDRKFRLEPDVDSYLSIGFNDGHETQAVSFNPSDGINTTQIVNYDASNDDYALLTKKTVTYVDDIICDTDWSDEQIWVEFISTLISCTTTIAGNILQTTGIEEGMYFEEMRSRLVSSATTLGYDGEADAIELTTMADWKAVKVNKPFSNTTREVVEHEMVSRWFILDAVRQRTGQYLLHLKRDTLADYSDNILSANFFCERGYLDESNPLICNNEGMTFNQLKSKEQLIKGTFDTPWLVGYVAKDDFVKDSTTITSVRVEDKRRTPDGMTISELASNTGISEATLTAILSQETTKCLQDKSTVTYNITANGTLGSEELHGELVFSNNNYLETINNNWLTGSYARVTVLTLSSTSSIQFLLNATQEVWDGISCDDLNKEAYGEVVLNLQQNGSLKYYLDNFKIVGTDGNLYKYHYNINQSTSQRTSHKLYCSLTLISNILNKYANVKNVTSMESLVNYVTLWSTVADVSITKEQVIGNNSYEIPLSVNRKHCLNSTYDIFAIPLKPLRLSNNGNLLFTTIDDEYLAKSFAMEIATQLSNYCYDVQLLPFCPVDNYPIHISGISPNRKINQDIKNLTIDQDFDFITQGDTGDDASIIYWLEEKDVTFQTYVNLNYTEGKRKQESNTDFIRIVSPTGTGSFEMNLAKNLGMNYVTINCTLKPYQPFIQIRPHFSGNYGLNFEDYRGLICQGDYSIDRVSDKFIDYSLANKNYQAIFNKELSVIDYNNRLADLQSGVGAVTGTIGGALGGAMGGMKVGGAGGAVVGAIAGLGAGAIGGAMNYTLGKEARAVERNLTVDRYNWNLGNIKSQPASLSKIDNFNVISKIYPYIEFYTCTDEEKQAFESAMKYNGYTVGIIGRVKDFINPDDWQWIKGEVIQLGLDNHTAQDIYSELKKGVFARNYEFSK